MSGLRHELAIGDQVTVGRLRCGILRPRSGAVWTVAEVDEDSGLVSITSPDGFTVEVLPEMLTPAPPAPRAWVQRTFDCDAAQDELPTNHHFVSDDSDRIRYE